MPKSVFSEPYRFSVGVLADARRAAGLTQAEVARRVGKDQSFMSIVEGAQRRIDLIEFVAICRAIGVDASELFGQVEASLPDDLKI